MNITTYVNKNKADFHVCPFNEADSLVLSQLAYLQYPRSLSRVPFATFSELLPHCEQMAKDTFFPKANEKLMHAVAKSPRFKDVKIGLFRQRNSDKRALRFAGVTFVLPNGVAYVAFRGTDTTVVGWKEDFNMSFLKTVPSHAYAQNYLNIVASTVDGELIVGGHSKGGNLAVYASTYAQSDVKKRIVAVYDHDGPGFRESIYEQPAYVEISSRIFKTVPRDSVVGMLLETHDVYDVVDCNTLLLLQHNPFSWIVKGNCFKKVPKTSRTSEIFDEAFGKWLAGMDMPTRRKMVKAIFAVVEGAGESTFTDISKKFISSVRGMHNAYKNLDEEGKGLMSLGGKRLLKLWFGVAFSRQKGSLPKQ